MSLTFALKMGLQHYKIYLVPSEFEGDPEEDGHWEARQPDSALLDRYCQVLPRDTSWGNVSEFRSDESFGSVLYVWRDDERVRSLQLEWTPGEFETLKEVCSLAIEMGCSIWSRDTGRILDPNIADLMADWKNTKSARFVEDPAETLVNSALALEANAERTRRGYQA